MNLLQWIGNVEAAGTSEGAIKGWESRQGGARDHARALLNHYDESGRVDPGPATRNVVKNSPSFDDFKSGWLGTFKKDYGEDYPKFVALAKGLFEKRYGK